MLQKSYASTIIANYDIAPNNSLGINLLRDKHLQRTKMSFFY